MKIIAVMVLVTQKKLKKARFRKSGFMTNIGSVEKTTTRTWKDHYIGGFNILINFFNN